ncbi:hypothetical protein SAMN05216343_101113 [Oscillibacter sp. PC13]|uniref:hypothetical protein n=1 Tax=Oscillibacter sp. PC13 TaxID=1855299 RepID=UPI0008E8C59C|nr:hypothetical protein [Oscillibacter sp. PC13]SFO95601.1 hypothetical protein SAMN05216343_101113 [Oscillibacter sp. PC13]
MNKEEYRRAIDHVSFSPDFQVRTEELLQKHRQAMKQEDPLLAAFESEGALLLDETVQSGDYTITLAGLVSGRGISKWCQDAEADRTPMTDAELAALSGEKDPDVSQLEESGEKNCHSEREYTMNRG